MPALATTQGTEEYARRFRGALAPESFRVGLKGLRVSSLGLGSYLGREDDRADEGYRQAVLAAVQGGVNVLDTAVNYREQRSERAIGRALEQAFQGGFRREELVVATKGGYVPSRDPEGFFEEEIVRRGLASAEDLVAGCHCIAKGYLRHQLSLSLANLSLSGVDIYYLHNPEQQLSQVDRPTFEARIQEAFSALEEEVQKGRIGCYGTATWNGYRLPLGSEESLSLEALFELARSIAGESHHFRVVQLPLNLAMTEALTHKTQSLGGREVSLLEAAEALGVSVMTSASLLQGRLSRGLPPALQEALPGLSSDAQRAAQFSRSAPGVLTALVGMGRAEHVLENLALLGVPPMARGAMSNLSGRP